MVAENKSRKKKSMDEMQEKDQPASLSGVRVLLLDDDIDLREMVLKDLS